MPYSPEDHEWMQHMVQASCFAANNCISTDLTGLASYVLTPSIHMPSWLCTQAMRVVRSWQEPLEAIDDEGARAEGFCNRDAFMQYFGRLHPNMPLSTRVEVIRFQRFTTQGAVEAGGFEVTIHPKPHWPEGWKDHLPDWAKGMPIEAA